MRFDWQTQEFGNVTFSSIKINTTSGEFEVSQPDYYGKLQNLWKEPTITEARYLGANLSWIRHSRPEISCVVARASEVTERNIEKSEIDGINKIVTHLQNTPAFVLRYRKSDVYSPAISAYGDASFPGNKDLASQLGMVIFLSDRYGNFNLIYYGSYKDRRATRAILAGKIHAFGTAFDFSCLLEHELPLILGTKIPIHMLTDSKLLFDLVTKTSHTTEKRLMIDIACIRDAFRLGYIDNVPHIHSEHNIVDSFTKMKTGTLKKICESAKLERPIPQWIIKRRTTPEIEDKEELAILYDEVQWRMRILTQL